MWRPTLYIYIYTYIRIYLFIRKRHACVLFYRTPSTGYNIGHFSTNGDRHRRILQNVTVRAFVWQLFLFLFLLFTRYNTQLVRTQTHPPERLRSVSTFDFSFDLFSIGSRRLSLCFCKIILGRMFVRTRRWTTVATVRRIGVSEWLSILEPMNFRSSWKFSVKQNSGVNLFYQSTRFLGKYRFYQQELLCYCTDIFMR